MSDSVELISHACVVINIGDIKVLCDPWLVGKCFNESWALAIPASKKPAELEEVDYLWFSHEHPDHFHIPTLKAFSKEFKERVTVLFKTDFTNKIPETLRKFGFKNIVLMPHRKAISLKNGVQAYSYHSRVMDSALFLKSGTVSVLNSNDAELTPKDCANIVADCGSPTVLLDQYGIAGSPGIKDYEPVLNKLKQNKLNNFAMHHRLLRASYSIPFASYHYFCSQENAFLNRFLATPADIAQRIASDGGACVVLYPGDKWTVGSTWDSATAMNKYDTAYAQSQAWPIDPSPFVSKEALSVAQGKLVDELAEKFPTPLLRKAGVIKVQLLDHPDTCYAFSLYEKGFFEIAKTELAHVQTASQPLLFAFTNSFGFQTLGVSGRYLIANATPEWRWLRMIMSARNSGVAFNRSFLLNRDSIGYIWSRRREAVDQLSDRIKTMF